MKYLLRTFPLIFLMIYPAFAMTAGDGICIRYQKEQNGRTLERGKIYFHVREGMYLLLDHPLNQRVSMRPEQFVYYYPDDNIALIMNNREQAIAPGFLQLFLYSDREDPGLTELGFILREHTMQSDTLIKAWELKGVKKREYVRIEMYYHRERVYKSLSYDASGDIIKQVRFADWRRGQKYFYPMHIRVGDEAVTYEYRFDDLQFIAGIPDSVKLLFLLPEDCEINAYTW
ncbi:MAG: hypothetical protein K0B52_06245 [FCB group bacterium]|nr:hypothetical protein [FCB group bacterium]